MTTQAAFPGHFSTAFQKSAAESLATALEQLTLDSLEWAERHLGEFEVPTDITDPDSGHDLNWTVKPLGELAQLSGSIQATARPDSRVAHSAAALLEFCWQQTDSGAVLLELFRGEPQATYPLEIYAAFARAGLRCPALEDFAATVCGTDGWRMTEQDPNRRLGILQAERSAGLPPHASVPDTLLRTWLGGLPEPWTLDQRAGYCLTHTVFHLTSWGLAPQRLPDDLDRYLRCWVPAWLDGTLEAGHWDLSCELLAVAGSTRQPPPLDVVVPAWQRIAAARGPDGALPETGTPLESDDPRAFPASYHSTLAAGFAAALTANRLRGAPPGNATAGGREGTGAATRPPAGSPQGEQR